MDQENNNVPPRKGGSMLSRLRKKHAWDDDLDESGHDLAQTKAKAGPAPCLGNNKRSWARPWDKEQSASNIPAVTDDDVSLGSVGSDADKNDVAMDSSLERMGSSRPMGRRAPAPAPLSSSKPPADPAPTSTKSKSSKSERRSRKNRSRSPKPQKEQQQQPQAAVEAPLRRRNTSEDAKPTQPLASKGPGLRRNKTADSVPKPKPKSRPPPVDKPLNSLPSQPTADELTEENKELLAIDFERDGVALREAIAEDVLAMWEDQGLYSDMPEIRDELLKGIVDQKFQALKDEQSKVVEQKQLASMPKLNNAARMSIIAEEEEEDSSDEEEEEHLAVMPEGAEFDDELFAEEIANMTKEERAALVAFNVHEELESKLKMVDTSEEHSIEAAGRLGMLTEREEHVPIKDLHAFNKFKLHHAVEKRVSQIFTEDHHVVTSPPVSPKREAKEKVDMAAAEAEEEDENPLDASSATAPVRNTTTRPSIDTASFSQFDALLAKKNSVEDEDDCDENKRPSIDTTSFSQFDALLAKKKPVENDDDYDEWTECEEITVVEPTPQDLKKIVADMDAKLKAVLPARVDDADLDYDEYTVKEETVVEAVNCDEVDVDQLSEQRERERQERLPRSARSKDKKEVARVLSSDSSYLEMTVVEEPTKDHSRRTDNMDREAKQALSHQQSSMQSFGAGFPSITCNDEFDDDDMTQLTFDQDIDGGISTTQDHNLAEAYFQKTSGHPKVPPSPKSRHGSISDSQTMQTFPMDESYSQSYSQREGSLDSGSRDASTALSKAVAKILRVEIWSPKAKKVQAAMEQLANAASQGHHQRANIARLGGVIAIVRAMQSHPRNLSIQVSACAALAHLSVDYSTQEAIAEVGGRCAIVTAMESHPDKLEVQQAACRALANITRPMEGEQEEPESDSEEDDDGPSSGSGVVHALVNAMNKYPMDSEIQAKAFGSLANLCLDNKERLQELSDTGGLTAMTMALQKPWQNKMDQHEAISTLSILLRSLAELGAGAF